MSDKKRAKSNYLVWLDLEMTGLDPEQHVIIEMATIITDNQLHWVENGPDLAIQYDAKRIEMEAWSKETHKKSGLIDRIAREGVPLKEAEEQTLAFVKRYCGAKETPLCGNSIGHDRRFLTKYMPTLHDHFHYRSIDVSSVKELVQRWFPNGPTLQKKQGAHRAMDDIRESVAEIQFYKERYFLSNP
jgi:oligoribonuclease